MAILNREILSKTCSFLIEHNRFIFYTLINSENRKRHDYCIRHTEVNKAIDKIYDMLKDNKYKCRADKFYRLQKAIVPCLYECTDEEELIDFWTRGLTSYELEDLIERVCVDDYIAYNTKFMY